MANFVNQQSIHIRCPFVPLIAKHCDLEAYEFIHYGGDVHIYDDHLEQVKEQIFKHI